MDNNLNNITKMYDKLTYYDQYGGTFILFIIITIVVILLISYFHTMINVQPIINDWPNQRCKPNIIPFAGLINRPEGLTASEFTSQNFTYCIQNNLASITGDAVQPLTYVTQLLQYTANIVQSSIQSIRAMFDKVRTSMQNVSEEIMGRIMNMMAPLMQIIISFRDLVGKIEGAMTSGLFMVLGSFLSLKSLIGVFVKFVIRILIALSVMIAGFWLFPFTWSVAISSTVIFIAIAIPLAIMLAFMSDILKINSKHNIPKVKCFDKNTLIKMNDGNHKKIIDIQTGDVLYNNNVVTAKIKVTTEGSKMYYLNNIIVSDSHIVKWKDKWIHVSEHPNAIKFAYYTEDFLYCLNTTNKTIEINDLVFADWDDLYDANLDKILTKLNCNKESIHQYLDCGFSGHTKILLKNKQNIHLNKININDILENGEKVYGIVEIDGSSIDKQYLYHLDENRLIKGYYKDFNCLKNELTYKYTKLYHLLTDKGRFTIENIMVNDYNSIIDDF